MYEEYPSHGVFVAIDGIDGCGKTTVAREIAQRYGAIYFHTPSDDIKSFMAPDGQSLRDFVDLDAEVYERFLFYLWSVAHASRLIEGLLYHSNVVCDRYWASTVAYHRAMAPELHSFDISWLPLIQPDYYFLLDVSDPDICVKRIEERAIRNSNDLLLEKDRELQALVQHEFHSLELIRIDASQSIVNIVLEILMQLPDKEVEPSHNYWRNNNK